MGSVLFLYVSYEITKISAVAETESPEFRLGRWIRTSRPTKLYYMYLREKAIKVKSLETIFQALLTVLTGKPVLKKISRKCSYH